MLPALTKLQNLHAIVYLGLLDKCVKRNRMSARVGPIRTMQFVKIKSTIIFATANLDIKEKTVKSTSMSVRVFLAKTVVTVLTL